VGKIKPQNILVTGANGFIGKNVVTTFETLDAFNVLKFTSEDSIESLSELLNKADYVFHLAGVNRPKQDDEFTKGNLDLTKQLTTKLVELGKNTPILFTSSTQAVLDNAYGRSKKGAEDALIEYAETMNANVSILRLPNVFGKWSRPNYNSVVATWCYQISRNLDIQVNNENTELTLVYVDDVVKSFLEVLEDTDTGRENIQFCEVNNQYSITLGELKDTLLHFRNSRESLKIADFSNPLAKKLYTTYLSYLPTDEFGYELNMRHDNRGWLAEVIKSDQMGQIFISTTKPGITRGNHWHHSKVEKFLVLSGKGSIRFRSIFSDEIIEYEVSGEQLTVLDIPPGYTHSITNIGTSEMITLFWANEPFDLNNPDTNFLEV
jgi:UDP-2-acetamido-2,6-beta-L-arabino-hexul-4-ose reductase